MSGDTNLMIEARTALLDACAALEAQHRSVILVGAQAIYLHTGHASFAIAETTKDSDIALDPRVLSDDPLVEEALKTAGFHLDPTSLQPGAWLSPRGIPVDLMVPEYLAGISGRRAAKIPPHGSRVARRTVGLEASVVDHAPMIVRSLADDDRSLRVNVAGPAALLVAKMHKIAERIKTPSRLNHKDAHDSYRLLAAIPTENLATSFQLLLSDAVSVDVTRQAIDHLRTLFAAGPDARGSAMAGSVELGVGQPEVVAGAASYLAQDTLAAIGEPLV